ncbi:MAG: chemotaxis protein CheW [Acidobacteriota bacterium]|nr:chemotaxis protein CheW [Acidobacteriota bacterium]
MTEATESACTISMCGFRVGEGLFGIDTREIREVLRMVAPQPVPLAPDAISGVVMYRGDVLTVVSLRALLGRGAREAEGTVLVLDDCAAEERFGLAVDSVQGVLSVQESTLEANPSTLDPRRSRLFAGFYATPSGLMARLDTSKVTPARITEEEDPERRGHGC